MIPAAVLLVHLILPQHPGIQPVPVWTPEQLGEEQCPVGTHLHGYGLVHDMPGPEFVGDSKCHRDDNDEVVPEKEEGPKFGLHKR
jgi:hypothetical protein